MRDLDKEITKIIEYLQGSCNTINQAVAAVISEELDENFLTQKQLEEIDSELFCCETCGWWCEISDQGEDENGEPACKDCLN